MELIKTENAALVIEALRDGPKTILQLVARTGISDRQIRITVNELSAKSFILTNGFHNRSVLWRINSAIAGGTALTGALPYHDIKASGGSANIVDIVLAAMVRCQPVPLEGTLTKADYHTRTVFPLLAKYLGLVTAFEPDMQAIEEVRSELLQCWKTINSTAFMLKQILEYKDYWKPETIKEFREAPIIISGSQEIADAYELALRYLEGKSGDRFTQEGD